MLEGCLVLDCSDQLGWLAGRILADLGAEVLKLDAPATDRLASDWQAYNVNKIALDVDVLTDAGRKRFNSLVPRADIVIACYRPGSSLAAVFDYERLRAINPRAIVVVISPFGLTGPRAGWRASDIELMAASGAMSLAGEPGGAPLRISVPQSYCWAGAQAAVGALAALNHRNVSGQGQLVDVSGQASVVISLAMAPAFWDIAHQEPSRAGTFMTGRSVKGARYRVFWPCKDGYLNFILYGGTAGRRTINNWPIGCGKRKSIPVSWRASIGPASIRPARLRTRSMRSKRDPQILATLTKREFLAGAHRREMLGYPVSTVADIAEDPQLEAREFWQMVAGPDGVMRRHGGCFAVIDGKRPRHRGFRLEPEATGPRGDAPENRGKPAVVK